MGSGLADTDCKMVLGIGILLVVLAVYLLLSENPERNHIAFFNPESYLVGFIVHIGMCVQIACNRNLSLVWSRNLRVAGSYGRNTQQNSYITNNIFHIIQFYNLL